MSVPASPSIQSTVPASSRDETLLLASRLEQSRARVQQMLLENPSGRSLLAERFLFNLSKDIDISELVNCKFYDEIAEQNSTSVQPNPKQIAENIAMTMTAVLRYPGNSFPELQKLHFLPAFLLQVTEKTIATTRNDKAYRQRLLQQCHKLEDLRQSIVMRNRKLVAFIARRMKTGNVDVHDVMQEGMVGLLKAVDRFDHRRDIRFSTYASYWIKQTISRLVVRQDKIVRLPFGLAEKASQVVDIMRTYYLENHRWPGVEYIKSHCELSVNEIKTIVRFYQTGQPASSDENNDEPDQDIMANLEQQSFRQPLDELTQDQLNRFIIEAIDTLPQREADILALRFGLKHHQETTLQGIAEQMHVTRERIRQIQNIALQKLRDNFGFELQPFLQTHDGH